MPKRLLSNTGRKISKLKRQGQVITRETVGAHKRHSEDDDFSGIALPLEEEELLPWFKAICKHGGDRISAGLKHALCEFFKLRAALRPSEGLQLVPKNFQNVGGRWYLDVVDNGFEESNVGKLRKWGERRVPMDTLGGQLLDVLFSPSGLRYGAQTVCCRVNL